MPWHLIYPPDLQRLFGRGFANPLIIFLNLGFLPPHIRNQAITKGVAPDSPVLYGARPICKDFLKGDLLTYILIFGKAKT